MPQSDPASADPDRSPLLRWGPAVLPGLAAIALLAGLVPVWAARLTYPFDLEWMEGGILVHAWRILSLEPVYAPPSPEFVPFVYPPGYAATLAALGSLFGLSLWLGRALSLLALVAAAASVPAALQRLGGPRWLGLAASVTFLGTYPQSGAFYDLVRPDTLAIALAGWSVVAALGTGRRAAVIAGLLLAAAVATKHNLGAFAAPIAFGIALRSGRDAGAFVAAFVLPVVLGTTWLQLSSDGAFLTYLLEVPLSHPVRWEKGLNDTVREWGMALPVMLPLGAVGLVYRAARTSGLPPWLTAGVPVWAGMGLGWWLTYAPPPPPVWTSTTGGAAFALAAGALAAAVWAADCLRTRLRGELPEWREVLVAGVVVSAAVLALWMRAHHGGFVNVHAPLYWSAALGGALLLSRASASLPGAALASVVLTAQLGWSAWRLHPERLVPTDADREAGWRLVERMRELDGPVLSPFASWMPVLAGKSPSLHAMAVWDCNHRDGPFFHDLWNIEKEIRAGRWAGLLVGTQPFMRAVGNHYRLEEDLFEDGDDALMPKTGWRARPEALWVPRESEW